MFARFLAAFAFWNCYCLLNIQVGEEDRTHLASKSPSQETTIADQLGSGTIWLVGAWDERESKESREFSLRPSLLQFQGTSTPHSTCELNDVALFHMQGQQYAEDDSLSGLSSSLECGLVSTTSVQVKEQQKEEPGCSRLQIDRKSQSGSRCLGSFSGQTALDIEHTGHKGQQSQSGSRNFCGEAAWDAATANSASSTISRSTGGAYSRGGANVTASQGHPIHGHGTHGVNGQKVGRTFHAGSEGSIQQNIDSWPPEQVEQAQVSGGSRSPEDQGLRWRVDGIRQQHHQQGSSSWRNVSELQSGSHGDLQCKDSRTGSCKTGDDQGFAIHAGSTMDGADHSGSTRFGAAFHHVTRDLANGGSCGANRSHRRDGGRRIAGGRGTRQRFSWEVDSQGDAPFSWIQLTDKGGDSPSQGESTGCERCQREQKGPRQGRQDGDMTQKDSGVCCGLASLCGFHDVCAGFRHEVEQFWQSHFQHPYSWTDGLRANEDRMPLDEEDACAFDIESTRYVQMHPSVEEDDSMNSGHCIYTWVAYQQERQVEKKFEPLIFSDGSFDSLEWNDGLNVPLGYDQVNMELIQPMDLSSQSSGPLRDSTEGNVDLCVSQAILQEPWISSWQEDSSGQCDRVEVHGLETVQGAYSWCQHAVQRSHSDGGHVSGKHVHFSDRVQVRFVHDTLVYDVGMDEGISFAVLRSFWHLHGQIAVWDDLQIAFTRLAERSRIDLMSDNFGTVEYLADETTLQQHNSDYLDDVHESAIWWQGLTELCVQEDPRPEFIATWFLAPQRFHVCLRSRRVKYSRSMQFREFEEACREVWFELMDGSPLKFLVVAGQPGGLPSTRAHVIIVQGDLEQWNAALMKGTGLPPLMSVRAVLYDSEITVREFFQAAQYPEACHARNYLCCIEYEQNGETHRLVDHEGCVLPIAQYVIGCLCPLEVEEDDRDTISTESTDIPSLESEDDHFSTIALSVTETIKLWTWEQHVQISNNDEGRHNIHLLHDGSLSKCAKEDEVDDRWSWAQYSQKGQVRDGSEGNVDLTWSSCSKDKDLKDLNDNNEVAWMSNRPVLLQFERPDPYPWDMGALADLEEDEEENQADVVFADQEQAQVFIDQALEGIAEDDQQWMAITYGLGLVDLGRRDVEFSPWRLYELTDKIRTLWADHLRYGSITLFYVNPQPCEVAGPRSLVVLVVIESPDDMNVDVRNVLVIQRGPRHLPLRPAPYGAKIFTDLSHRDALVQLDMHKYCKPFRMRDCMIRLGFNVMEADHRYEVNHGMLCTVRVEEIPELVQRASEMIDRVEDFYLQVEEVQNMEGSVHQVICHVHGITPENRPLGWRQLVLEGDDLLHLDWIDQLRQLWPFASQDARIVFCTMATDDLREADQIRFHFVVDYGAREGVPILVRQQILAAQTMPQQNEGASEFWAITVMEGAVSAELFTALAIYPFWFASAMRQNVRPHIHVNGRRMEGLQSMWQHGDFVHIRLQVWRVHHMLSILLNDGDEVQTDDVVEHTSFLQLRSGLKHRDGPLAEICAALKSCEEPERESKSMHFSVHHQYDVANPEHGTCRPEGRWDDIAELQSLLRNVLSRGHEGINEDFADIPSLHPHAQIACLLSHAHSDKSPVYHVFTDGSCKHDRATWAITILQQHDLHGRNIFHRVGYAAGCVSDDLGQFDPTAMDAEATAIIAMAEFALGQCFHQAITVYCHFDALVVGFGATGEYNIPMQHGSHSQREDGKNHHDHS